MDEALEFIETSGARIYESEGHRLKATCIAALGAAAAANDAERWFASALAIADRQGALSLALRAATGFAEYCHRRGRRKNGLRSSPRPRISGVYFCLVRTIFDRPSPDVR